MGFWDWFRSKPKRVVEADRIWLSATAKLAGLAAEVSRTGTPILLVAHFPATLRDVEQALAAVGLPAERLDGPVASADLLARLTGPARALLALSDQLRPADPPEEVAGDPVPILVAERHFLKSHDDTVVRFADGLGRPAGVNFFLSLDEPLMQRFAGQWVSDVLRRLGLKEGEAIESPMVQRRVRAAQMRMAVQARGDEPADSADEWFERNGGGR